MRGGPRLVAARKDVQVRPQNLYRQVEGVLQLLLPWEKEASPPPIAPPGLASRMLVKSKVEFRISFWCRPGDPCTTKGANAHSSSLVAVMHHSSNCLLSFKAF